MQNAMREAIAPADTDAREIIDILMAISVTSQKLAEKLRKLNEEEKIT